MDLDAHVVYPAREDLAGGHSAFPGFDSEGGHVRDRNISLLLGSVLICSSAICTDLTAQTEMKAAVPSPADQEAIRLRIRSALERDYSDQAPSARRMLADRLIKGATEEKDSATAYVMLSEALQLASEARDIGRVARAARTIEHDFEAARGAEVLAAALSVALALDEVTADCVAVAQMEVMQATAPEDQLRLGQKWLEIVQDCDSPGRRAAAGRALYWATEAADSEDIAGLARTEAIKAREDAILAVEREDAKSNQFTLYRGKWSIRYDNGYVHEYVISPEGALAFDKCINPQGVPFVKPNERRGRLIRRGTAVLALFSRGKVVEKLSLDGEKLLVERFDPASQYPKRPVNKGEGTRQK